MEVSNITRHPIFYYPDGDIVLAANTRFTDHTTATQLFRVHCVYLAHTSEVFRDMFAVASPVFSDAEAYDGVPLVGMAGDDAADIESLLDVLYTPTRLHVRLTKTPKGDLPVVFGGLVRVAQKYLVQDIAQVVIRYIADAWPKTLEEWDAAEKDLDVMEPASAYLFALEHGLDDMLPAAFYKLVTTPTTDLWDHDTYSGARWDMLVVQNELLPFVQARDEICAAGRARMGRAIKWVSECAPSAGWRCAGGPSCAKEFKTTYAKLIVQMLRTKTVDYLELFDVIKAGVTDDTILCSLCRAHLCSALHDHRQGIWDSVVARIVPNA